MAVSCLKDFEVDEYFDYGVMQIGDEYWPLTPTESDASSISDMSEGPEEVPEADLDALLREKVSPSDARAKFNEQSGGKSKMPTSKGAAFARSLGLAPSQEDEKKLKEECGDECSFEQAYKWLACTVHPEDSPDELAKFFARFDEQGTGSLKRAQVYHILTNFGDKLTTQEIDKILQSAGETGDRINYKAVCSKMLEP